MAGSPDRPRCSKCHHDCHCDNLVCSHPMGVGMTDKNAPCGCGVCECTPNRPDWGQLMWFFLISSIASSIIGSAADSWFSETKMGKWFYRKVDDVASWASRKLGLKVLADEENWKTKYPNVSLKIDKLEARIKQLEEK